MGFFYDKIAFKIQFDWIIGRRSSVVFFCRWILLRLFFWRCFTVIGTGIAPESSLGTLADFWLGIWDWDFVGGIVGAT